MSTRARLVLERTLRTLALLGVATALWLASRPAGATRSAPSVLQWTAGELADSSAAAMTTALFREVLAAGEDTPREDTPREVLLELPAIPGQRARALLGVVNGADIGVRWRDETRAAGLALSATAVAGPSGAIDVRVAGPRPQPGATNRPALPVLLGDAGGLLDSIRSTPVMAWRLASVSPPLRATLGPLRAATMAQVPARLPTFSRRAMLMALPGWESKFVAAALEEAGWHVDGRYRLSPSTVVTVGEPGRLDTARYAVVVVLDSMMVDAAALTRFVQQGGGLVLSGDALRVPSLARLSPVRATAVRGGVAGALLTNTPARGLEAWELVTNRGALVVRSDASDHGHPEPVLVAQRVGAGRVVASAYRRSWRWRMEGTDNGAAEHRAWWGSVLALAAGVSVPSDVPFGDAYPGDAAPYADLVARVGRPDTSAAGDGAAGDRLSGRKATGVTARLAPLFERVRRAPGVLFLVIALSLLGEWSSRRLRGHR